MRRPPTSPRTDTPFPPPTLVRSARRLAAVADRAVFGSSAPVEADSALAWRMVREEQQRLRRDVAFWARFRGALSPASIIRHLRPTSARHTLEPDPGDEDRKSTRLNSSH